MPENIIVIVLYMFSNFNSINCNKRIITLVCTIGCLELTTIELALSDMDVFLQVLLWFNKVVRLYLFYLPSDYEAQLN